MMDFRKTAAIALSLVITAGLSSCGGSLYVPQKRETVENTTVPFVSEYENTEYDFNRFGIYSDIDIFFMERDKQDIPTVGPIADLPDEELENKTVKWISYFDPWSRFYPYEHCSEKTEGAVLFEKKYGGEIISYWTTWERRFDDISIYNTGGEGIDLSYSNLDMSKCIDHAIMSYDDYVDWEAPIWNSVKDINDLLSIGGNHYILKIRSHEGTEYMVYYNTDIISENGLDDPWELYKNGEWTMGKFMEMMEGYADASKGRYGVGCYFNELNYTYLYLTNGVSPVSLKDGKLVNNINTPDFDRAMKYQFELYRRGLVLDNNTSDGLETGSSDYLRDGNVLFYISPEISKRESYFNEINLACVPIPQDEQADRYYYPIHSYGYFLCNGAENPEGAIRLMECVIASSLDEGTRAAIDEFYRLFENVDGWADDMAERKNEMLRLAAENPVFDAFIFSGLPEELYTVIDESVYQQTDGADWESVRESANEKIDPLIEEINSQLEAMSN